MNQPYTTRGGMMRRLYLVLALSFIATSISSAQTKGFTDAQKSFWVFQPVKNPAVPAIRNKAWMKNPIDAFVLAKLEEKQLEPNKPADKLTLLRRATIDMTGLPPTEQEITAFINDNSANAFE